MVNGDLESDNKLLRDDMLWASDNNIDYHPTITINNFTYRGDIDFVDVREAICSAYSIRPKDCTLDEIWNTEPTQNPDRAKMRFFRLARGIRAWIVIGVLLIVVIV